MTAHSLVSEDARSQTAPTVHLSQHLSAAKRVGFVQCILRARRCLVFNPRFHPVFTVPLGAVKSGVGIVEDRLSVPIVVSRSGRNPDAHGEGKGGLRVGTEYRRLDFSTKLIRRL